MRSDIRGADYSSIDRGTREGLFNKNEDGNGAATDFPAHGHRCSAAPRFENVKVTGT